jgi:hypothetical protein
MRLPGERCSIWRVGRFGPKFPALPSALLRFCREHSLVVLWLVICEDFVAVFGLTVAFAKKIHFEKGRVGGGPESAGLRLRHVKQDRSPRRGWSFSQAVGTHRPLWWCLQRACGRPVSRRLPECPSCLV